MGQWVLTALLQATGISHQIFLTEAVCRNQFRHLGLTFGQCAGFIDHHRIDLLHTLKRFGITDQHTILCADRKSTRLNSSHVRISYAVFCLKKKKKYTKHSKLNKKNIQLE